ncbi:hypothetical protein [Planctomicrobium piriforme]|uniref:hypothetical protein n=1 Tax=Planctomicrobium piriforme TaxID=1576369 RepID=UPI001113D8BD|nr:hypothetical protein [Planctomicrobium piriforme]
MIEMLVVISLTGTIGVLTAQTMVLLIRLGNASHDQTAEAIACERLGRAFRRDVHAAEAVEFKPAEAGAAMTLHLPGEMTITYEPVENGARRTQTAPAAVISNDEFVLLLHAASFQGEGNAVELLLTPVSSSDRVSVPSLPPLKVVAIRGSDALHTTGGAP